MSNQRLPQFETLERITADRLSFNADGSAKGDWDVGITIDILESLPALDRVFLLSGDGDFDRLVRTVQTKHEVPMEVYGIPELTADSLKKVASCFHPINESLLIQSGYISDSYP